jgi:ribonuclease P protein component
MPKIQPIKKRADFLLAAGSGFKFVRPSIIVQSRKRADTPEIRAGFVASKKLGNAIIRNRAKRRMRAAVSKLLPELGIEGCDYVFIGREKVYKGTFGELLSDMERSLKHLGDQMSAKN